jgi:hypothetical protein
MEPCSLCGGELEENEAARLALSFKTVQEMDRMCNQDAKTDRLFR